MTTTNKVLMIQEVVDRDNHVSGFVVHTEQNKISMTIENYQSCCEDWGYMVLGDDISDFIGSEFLKVEIVDENLLTKQVIDLEEGGAMFINVCTNSGVLQFALYNSHNGYYGHDCKVSIDDTILDVRTL